MKRSTFRLQEGHPCAPWFPEPSASCSSANRAATRYTSSTRWKCIATTTRIWTATWKDCMKTCGSRAGTSSALWDPREMQIRSRRTCTLPFSSWGRESYGGKDRQSTRILPWRPRSSGQNSGRFSAVAPSASKASEHPGSVGVMFFVAVASCDAVEVERQRSLPRRSGAQLASGTTPEPIPQPHSAHKQWDFDCRAFCHGDCLTTISALVGSFLTSSLTALARITILASAVSAQAEEGQAEQDRAEYE